MKINQGCLEGLDARAVARLWRVITSFVIVLAAICGLELTTWTYMTVRSAWASMTVRSTTLAKTPAEKMAAYRAIFPDLSEQQISALLSIPYREVYAPWVGFRTDDIDMPLVHADGFRRATTPDRSGPDERAVDVWFFGGSTMEGTHVPDDRTLPSLFVRAAQEGGGAFRVTNFGQPYYYSKQEAHLFLSMILNGSAPRVAVFLDGLNDFLLPGASLKAKPVFSDAAAWLYAQAGKSSWQTTAMETNTGRLVAAWLRIAPPRPDAEYALPAGADPEAAYQTIAQAYVGNAKALSVVCAANGIICLFALQPVPFLEYDRSKDPLVDQRDLHAYEVGYPLIKAALRENPHFLALDDAFGAPKLERALRRRDPLLA